MDEFVDLTPEQIEEIVAKTRWRPPEHFVYFDKESGDIKMVTNMIDDASSDPYIKVNFVEIEGIMSGKEVPTEYKVVLDFTTGDYMLQHVSSDGPRSFNWNDEVYKLPKTHDNADVVLVQNLKNKTWSIEISDVVRKMLSRDNNYNNFKINFYVTDPDDVNVLHQVLRFTVKDVLSETNHTIEMTSESETSVYCRKMFNTYSHRIEE
jgi:hypothetical protein